jgi:hypothetical protein
MKTIVVLLALLTAGCTQQASVREQKPHTDAPAHESGTFRTATAGKSDVGPAEPFTNYLGEIRFGSGKRYRVLTRFRTVQAAIEKHGHSSVIVRDTTGRVVRIYHPDRPEQLPTGLIGNKLVFHFGNRRYLIPLEEKLPVQLCLPANQGCF